MVQWVVRSILHGGPIELFLIPASAPGVTKVYVLSCLWGDAYKRTLAADCVGSGFHLSLVEAI